ncbi:UNVERIFIED_CONTAM: hypothetical protein BEN50_10265, partial [Euhalothece sp. KZN 001]
DFHDKDRKYPPLSEFKNKKAITRLEQEQTWQGIFSGLSAVTPSIALSTPVSLTSSELATSRIKTNKAVEKIYNLIIVMKTLLEGFGDQVEIIPRVQVPKDETDIDQIDLFIRVPSERVYFCIGIRKIEKSKVVFNEKRETLMIRHKKRVRPWKPDPHTYLPKATSWLRKNKSTLFGRIGNDKRRPVCKVLVLLGSTQISKHHEAHYDRLGDNTFLHLNDRSNLFIVHHNDLVSLMNNFIKEYGKASKQTTETQPKKSKNKNQPKSKKVHRIDDRPALRLSDS